MNRETETSALKESLDIHSLLLTEYGTLREEILKRIELRSQVVSLDLIVFGTIMSFGLQARSSSIILLYPILAMFLAANWTHNGIRIKEIAMYIRDHIESRIGENMLAWEHRASPKQKPLERLNFLSASGIFIGTSLFAMVLALTLTRFDVIDILLFVFAAISVICSSVLLYLFFQKRFDKEGNLPQP